MRERGRAIRVGKDCLVYMCEWMTDYMCSMSASPLGNHGISAEKLRHLVIPFFSSSQVSVITQFHYTSEHQVTAMFESVCMYVSSCAVVVCVCFH